MPNFNEAVTKTLLREGGARYTETPGDTGGATKYGISQRAYPKLDIKNLTEQTARDLYFQDYWVPLSCGEIIDQGVAELLFDSAVNMGVGATKKIAEHALGSAYSSTAVNSAGAKFAPCFVVARIARYAAICTHDPSQAKFLLGWINRTLGAV